MGAAQATPESINVAVVRGNVTNGVTIRDLPAGGTVAQFDVSTRVGDGDRSVVISVPVALHDPSAAVLDDLGKGGTFVVVGRVKRRFFRVGGATQSRTEVVAEVAIPARRRAQVERALAAAVEELSPVGG